jgi:transcriptional regulator with XRE-family HTH domain
MEGLRDRINEVRDHYRLSNRGFAEAIGAKPAATNNYLNGTKEPSLEFVDKILSTYVDVSAEWLLRGVGSMFKEDKPTDDALLKELAEAKVKLLVQEGITKELRDMLLEKNNGKIAEERKSLVG